MFVEVVDVLDDPMLQRGAHGDVVEDRQVLHILAQAHAAGMRADRHAELRRQQQDRDVLVDSPDPCRVELEDVDRAGGYWTTRSAGSNEFHARTSGIYLRADPGDKAVLDGNDAAGRAALIEQRLEEWKSLANS